MWNLPYYFTGAILIFGFIKLINKKHYNLFDLIIIVFNVYLIIPALLSPDKPLFIATYLLPFSGYYLIRTQFGAKISFYKLMVALSFVIPIFTLIEFIPENFLDYKIFDYEAVNVELLQSGSIYGGERYDKKINPLIFLFFPEYSLLERPLGASMSPQTTGAIIAALGLFIISYSKTNGKNYKLKLLIIVIALIASMSGTGIIIFLVCFPFVFRIKNKKIILPFILPFLIYLGLMFRGYSGKTDLVTKYIIYLLKLTNEHIANNIGNPMLIFGGNQSITMDIDYANFIFRFGIIGLFLFISLIIIFFKRYNKIKTIDNNVKSLFIFVVAILAANFHYDSVFRFPSSFILFMIFGYLSRNCFYLSHRKSVLIH